MDYTTVPETASWREDCGNVGCRRPELGCELLEMGRLNEGDCGRTKRNEETKHFFFFFLLKAKSRRNLQYVHRLMEKRARDWPPATKSLSLGAEGFPGDPGFPHVSIL